MLAPKKLGDAVARANAGFSLLLEQGAFSVWRAGCRRPDVVEAGLMRGSTLHSSEDRIHPRRHRPDRDRAPQEAGAVPLALAARRRRGGARRAHPGPRLRSGRDGPPPARAAPRRAAGRLRSLALPAARRPGVHRTRPDTTIPLACADAARLPFKSGAFNAIHCSWLLEHVPRAATVGPARGAPVLSPAGRLWLCEVENESLAFWPRLPRRGLLPGALGGGRTEAAAMPSSGASCTASARRPASSWCK